MKDDLVPVRGVPEDAVNVTSPANDITIPSLSPALVLATLIPYRIQRLPEFTMYELWKGNPRGCNAKELAMVVVYDNHFKLSYYPVDSSEMQIVDNLPFERLLDAVRDLKAAGFGGDAKKKS